MMQFFKGFYCNTYNDTVNGYNVRNDGCILDCGDLTLIVDPRNGGSWRCVDPDELDLGVICPGKFNTGKN